MTEITREQMIEWLDKSISAEKQWPEAVRAAWPISIPMLEAIRAALQQQPQGIPDLPPNSIINVSCQVSWEKMKAAIAAAKDGAG